MEVVWEAARAAEAMGAAWEAAEAAEVGATEG